MKQRSKQNKADHAHDSNHLFIMLLFHIIIKFDLNEDERIQRGGEIGKLNHRKTHEHHQLATVMEL